MHFVIIGGDGVQLLGGIYTPHPPPRFGTAVSASHEDDSCEGVSDLR